MTCKALYGLGPSYSPIYFLTFPRISGHWRSPSLCLSTLRDMFAEDAEEGFLSGCFLFLEFTSSEAKLVSFLLSIVQQARAFLFN